MARLAGRTAIVTGGAKGIGRHYSQALAAEGARVMIADIADGAGVAAEIAAKHGANSVTSAVADVSDEQAVKALVAQTIERFGKIDVLVNNAALYAPLQETEVHRDRRRPVGPGDGGQSARAVPDGEARGAAHDRAGLRQDHQYRLGHRLSRHPWMLHYVTTKGGIMAMTRALARELGEHGIRVNTLAPGFTLSDTVMSENPGTCKPPANAPSRPRRCNRDEHPQDLLGALVFLASADSDFVTGQTIAVDGGKRNT